MGQTRGHPDSAGIDGPTASCQRHEVSLTAWLTVTPLMYMKWYWVFRAQRGQWGRTCHRPKRLSTRHTVRHSCIANQITAPYRLGPLLTTAKVTTTKSMRSPACLYVAHPDSSTLEAVTPFDHTGWRQHSVLQQQTRLCNKLNSQPALSSGQQPTTRWVGNISALQDTPVSATQPAQSLQLQW